MQTNSYRLLVCDLRSDQLLTTIPVTGLGFDDFIGKPGTCTGTIQVTDEATASLVRSTLLPGRTAIYVQRGNDIWWGGVLWTRVPTSDGRGFVTVPFQAATFDSYFARRIILDTQVADDVDQLDIVRDLLDYAQGFTGGDIGIEYDPLVSGVVRDRTYIFQDLHRFRDVIDELSRVENGFEWRMFAYKDSNTGLRVRRLQLGYPKITAGSTDIPLVSPGSVLSYSLPEDGTTQSNVWQSRGASINQNQAATSFPLMSAVQTFPTDWDEGWPRLDGSSDYSSVEVQATLDAHAAADIARYRRPIVIPSIRVRLDGTITPALIGASISLKIKDTWYFEGHTARYRIVGMKVTPPERGEHEAADLFLEAI